MYNLVSAFCEGHGVTLETKEARHMFNDLLRHYMEDHRAYHTLNHIQEMLTKVSDFDLGDKTRRILLSILYHDVVYYPRCKENEYLSTMVLKSHALSFNTEDPEYLMLVNYAMSDILETGYHDFKSHTVLGDLDLAGFLSPLEPVTALVREEYHFVPEAEFNSVRARILGRFLESAEDGTLYHTDVFKHGTQQAVHNLKTEIARLTL